jgi:hypothetical protein
MKLGNSVSGVECISLLATALQEEGQEDDRDEEK